MDLTLVEPSKVWKSAAMRIPDHAFNRLTVLKKLRAAEPVSRTELARLTGLNGGTITAIVRGLLERGLVAEERLSSGSRGRPKLNLSINPEGAYVVGASMTDDGRLVTEIVDLRAQTLSSHCTKPCSSKSVAELSQQFAQAISTSIATSPVSVEDIAHVGIGLPAIIDSRSGVVKFFETLPDVPYPFAETIERHLGVATRVDNNINLLARAEHWFGDGTGVDNFTVVLLDLGLGAAQYQDGQLLVGSHGIEAELGHTKLIPERGRPCHCGARGCLQTYSSISAIVYQCAELAGQAPPDFLEIRDRFPAVVERAKAGDQSVAELFSRAGSHLGRALANHINMQDPDRIIVLCKSPHLIELVSEPFFAALERDTLPVLRDLGRVTFKEIDEGSFAKGAAAMVLEQVYQWE